MIDYQDKQPKRTQRANFKASDAPRTSKKLAHYIRHYQGGWPTQFECLHFRIHDDPKQQDAVFSEVQLYPQHYRLVLTRDQYLYLTMSRQFKSELIAQIKDELITTFKNMP